MKSEYEQRRESELQKNPTILDVIQIKEDLVLTLLIRKLELLCLEHNAGGGGWVGFKKPENDTLSCSPDIQFLHTSLKSGGLQT